MSDDRNLEIMEPRHARNLAGNAFFRWVDLLKKRMYSLGYGAGLSDATTCLVKEHPEAARLLKGVYDLNMDIPEGT